MPNTSDELAREIKLIRHKHHALKPDAAFVLWFVREHILDVDKGAEAITALTGISGDKSIDALVVDDKYKRIHLVQGKYHEKIGSGSEGRDALSAFADLAGLPLMEPGSLSTFLEGLDGALQHQVQLAISKINEEGYELLMYFLSTKKVSPTHRNDYIKKVGDTNADAKFYIYDAEWVTGKFNDYLVGAAPSVPELKLHMSGEEHIQSSGHVYRFDNERKMEAYIFSMAASEVGKLYTRVGVRLFARNIRGDLGPGNAKSINGAIRETVVRRPKDFWYFNNGITMVCSSAKIGKDGGEDFLTVEDPSIINGQQTTIALSRVSSSAAAVLVKVIVAPRREGDEIEHSDFINSIVKATNRQNAIKPADLIANDPRQVYIERMLRDLGYLYLRKKRSTSEYRLLFGSGLTKIGKEDLAKIVCAIMFGPHAVKKTDSLFEDPTYDSLFRSREPAYYLSRFWLMDNVYESVTQTELTRANWMILQYAWGHLKEDLDTKAKELRFRKMCEQDDASLKLLRAWLSGLFRLADTFYKKKRVKNKKGKWQDIRSFFTDTGVTEKFQKFVAKQESGADLSKKLERFKSVLATETTAE